jgi:putative ABC transport system permease protein
MKKEDRIWQLIARKMAGEASEEELLELQELVKDHPEFGYYAQVVTDLKKQPPKDDTEQMQPLLQRLKKRIAAEESVAQVAEHLRQETPWKKQPASVIRPFSNNKGILSNHLKIAWRYLFRNKAFSFVNISGLAIGMASAILILLWIHSEWTFDQFHSKKERIYQLYSRAIFDGELQAWGQTPMVMAPVIKSDYPEVEEVVRMNWVAAFILKTGDKQLQTTGFLTDPGVFKVFDFPLIKGDPNTALTAPHSIVITESLAKRLFGEEDAMGKLIKIDSNALFTVTGIVKKMPDNTRFKFDYLVPWDYMKEVGWYNDNWGISSIVHTYILLRPGITETAINGRLRYIIKAHADDLNTEVFAHPIKKWRLWSEFENGVAVSGNIKNVRLFGIIAGFILLIACINYMNLSTARSVKRAREVGIRKVVGAGKGSLIGQFILESLLFSFIAAILALLIVEPCIPWFNRLTYKNFYIPYDDPYFWLIAVAFILLTGLLAGSYPAFYLSSYRPIKVLKGTFKAVNALVTPRKVLVVVQFSFAIILIICTMIIYRQIRYGKQRDPGYNMDRLVYIYNKGNIEKDYPLIREELLGSGAITHIARTNSPITEIWSSEEDFEWAGKDSRNRTFFIKMQTDRDFVKTMGIQLIAGRDIDASKYPTDSTAILINESAAKALGFANPVGQTLTNQEGAWHIVGMIKNFIPGIPYAPLYPLVVQGPGVKSWFGTVTFRMNPQASEKANLATIKAIVKKYNPDYPVDHFVVKESYDFKFIDEVVQAKLAGLFAALTIFISCLGLFALAAYMAESRIKEIGIRKVLGASVTTITALLSKDFIKLVLVSFVIASPLAWWGMQHWLQNYAYKVSISWWIFALTGVLSTFVALATVSYQAIKTALGSPVKSLRSE